MGTTCGCGHTEITVFRPCGHSVCSNPCFIEMMRDKITFPKKTIVSGGVKFEVVGTLNLNVKFETQ